MQAEHTTQSAAVIPFPRKGFIINASHCRSPGPERQHICLLERGHDGDHQWSDWQGCRLRVPFGSGLVPFGGFAG